ncbi:tRNA lysidine(34) synthetase TilS [Octadecabacter sp. R77987]|uniref:tRNA lysidine(34) synthetase TilS n=1 Tax=Octadecabacter sp. R77987 TaxID=3093874 RepID=UPI003672D14E
MTAQTLDQQFAGAMGNLLGPDFPETIGLAVSGGGDSMALLALAHSWARVWGVGLRVASVDHGLRPDSAGEAAMVARECAALGHPHVTLKWQGWDGQGNLQDAARRARLRLIGGWRGDLRHVLMGHTRDDLAETFLMRVQRGSGVDGLAAMAPLRDVAEGFAVVRPLLGMRRADLRHYLRTLQVPWVDDPSNDDPQFSRVRMRQAIETLDLDVDRLADTARAMALARNALQARAVDVARRVAQVVAGNVVFDRDGFAGVEQETQLRLLAAGAQFVSSNSYRPRRAPLEVTLETILSGGTATLHGALVIAKGAQIVVTREGAAVTALASPSDQVWDNRWQIDGPHASDLTIRPLGDGISDCPDWRASGLPRAALVSSPAVWRGETLISAPIAGYNPVFTARIVADFQSFLLSH